MPAAVVVCNSYCLHLLCIRSCRISNSNGFLFENYKDQNSKLVVMVSKRPWELRKNDGYHCLFLAESQQDLTDAGTKNGFLYWESLYKD